MSRWNLKTSAEAALAMISSLRLFFRADFFIFLTDLLKQLSDKEGEKWLQELKKFTSGMTCWPDQPFCPYLKKTGEIEIGPVSGRRTFWTNKGMANTMEKFQLFRFLNPKDLVEALNLPKKKRSAMKLDIYEPDSDANYADLFLSLSSNIDRLCLDCQDQIMSVIEALPRTSKEFTIFFLKEIFNGQDAIFVVRIIACNPSRVFYDLYIAEMKNLPQYCVHADDGTRFIFPKQQ